MMEYQMFFRYGILFLTIVASGCVHISERRDVVITPSELNSYSSRYNGKIVLVRGYVTLEAEGYTLYESKYLNDEFIRRWESDDKDFDPKDYIKYCLTIAKPQLLYKNRSVVANKTIIIKGKFVDNYLNGKFIDFGACPLPTAIYVDKYYMNDKYLSSDKGKPGS